jgi:hypothetical protein
VIRVQWKAGKGATVAVPRPTGRGRKAYACVECDAHPFTSCVTWKEADGIRFKIPRKTLHKTRGEMPDAARSLAPSV